MGSDRDVASAAQLAKQGSLGQAFIPGFEIAHGLYALMTCPVATAANQSDDALSHGR